MSRITILMFLVIAISAQNLRRQSHAASTKNNGDLFGFILSPLIFILAFPVIWYNQRKASIDSRRLAQAQKICRSYSPTEHLPKQQLIHLSGQTVSSEFIHDNILGLSVRDAISLHIEVQVKEWRRMGGGSSSPIGLQWVTHNISDVQDKHNDPLNWVLNSETIYSTNTYIGKYRLSPSQASQCLKKINMVLNHNNIDRLKQSNPRLYNRHVTVRPNDDFIYLSSSTDYQTEGSMRVRASYCPTGPISVICQVSYDGINLQPYNIQDQLDGEAYCSLSNVVRKCFSPIKQINLVREEMVTKQEQISDAIESSKTFNILMRIVGYLMFVVSMLLFLSPISNLLGFIPLVGGFLKGASFFIFLLGAIIISIPLYLITFSIAWLVYNPRIGIPVFAVGLLLMVGLVIYNFYSLKNMSPVPAYSMGRPLLINYPNYY